MPGDDFELVDGFAEHGRRYGFGWFDPVRVRSTPETDELGLAGLHGIVYGQTTPSASGIPAEVGRTTVDYAVNVGFEEQGINLWFAPELLEALPPEPGVELELGDVRYVRTESGEWRRVRTGFLRRLWSRLG